MENDIILNCGIVERKRRKSENDGKSVVYRSAFLDIPGGKSAGKINILHKNNASETALRFVGPRRCDNPADCKHQCNRRAKTR